MRKTPRAEPGGAITHLEIYQVPVGIVFASNYAQEGEGCSVLRNDH